MTDERVAVLMSDRARLIKVIEGCFAPDSNRGLAADSILAALEADGFAWYRPDECEGVIVESCDYGHEGCRSVNHQYVPDSPPGTYRLVPVGGEG